MEHIKRIGAGFLDTMGAGRNKPPPDDLLVSCKKQLTDLRDEIMVVKQQFSQYAHQVVEAAEASVTLSKSVEKFYSKANHPGRSESVNMYKKVTEDIANRAVNTFHITVENGLISELSEWVQLIANLTEKICSAESTRTTAYDIQQRLNSLQNEYQEKKSRKQSLFGGSRESELSDLMQRINESSEAQKSLSIEYQKSRNTVAQQVKQLMEKRYRYFDRIYVQMLESQAEYFQHSANASKRFQRDIDYYRKQYPKTKEFQNSNGSLHKLATQILSETKKESIDAKDDDIIIEKVIITSPPPIPTTRPPPIKQAESNTKSPSTSASSSPVLNPQKEMEKAQSSPPITHTNGNVSKKIINEQSTHDILNLHGAAPPPPQKQDSLLTAMFGLKEDQKKESDPHGIFNLANPDHNDMLHGFTFNDDNKKENEANNDIFSDFMGLGSAQNGVRPHHGSQDSTSDWILASHNPPKEKETEKVSSSSLEQQMRVSFSQASYGNHENNNHNTSPKLTNSTTVQADINGTSVKVSSIKLSDKGKKNAQKAYDEAMLQREAKQQAMEDEQKEKVYWKDKHETKLNEWEFENGVRRNVRTMIGKLADVLPSNLNWKPIPMTKLLNDAQLKKGYFKAVRIVHPDKSIGRGDSIENQVICDYVFQALEQAFNTKFG